MNKDIYISNYNHLSNTLNLMKRLEIISLENKEFVNTIKLLFSKYTYSRFILFSVIYRFVKNNFLFEDDYNDEDLTAPYLMLKIKKGDCDDFALFTKTVLSILNVPAAYILFGQKKDNYSHIAVIGFTENNKAIIIDGTYLFNKLHEKFKFNKIIK